MGAITSLNIANAIVKLVAADALPALMGNLVMGNLVNRDYEATLARAGEIVNVPIPPTMSATNIAEGDPVTLQNPDLGNAQIMLSTHVEATFQIPDVTKVLAVPDLVKLYMQPAVVALAEKIESDLLGLYPAFTVNTAVGTGGSALTEATVDAAETALFGSMVPANALKYLVVDPTAYSALRQISRFSEFNTVGEAGLRAMIDGQVGKMKDFYIFRSQFIAHTGSSPVTTHNLAFARDAIALVVRRLPLPLPGTGAIAEYAELGNFGMRVTMSYQPNTLAQQFTVDVLYGVGALRTNFAVQVNRSGAGEEKEMNLRAYYLKIRKIEAELKEESVVMVSLETPEGGRAGTRTEVPRPLAAKLIVDGKAVLATPEDAAEFRAAVEAKWKAAHGAYAERRPVSTGALKPEKKS